MADRQVTDLESAIRSMQYRPFLLSQKYVEQQTRAIRDGAHPKIVEFSDTLIRKLAKRHGVPMFSHCIVRTEEDQKAAYIKGVSKTLAGAHTKGCATDVVHSVMAWDLDPMAWQMIGHLGHQIAKAMTIRIVWGGDDPGVDDTFDWDPAHWELADYREDIVHGYARKNGTWEIQVQV